MRKLLIISGGLVLLLGITMGHTQSRRRLESMSETFEASTDRPLEVVLKIDAAELQLYRSRDRHEGLVSIDYTRDEFKHRFDFDKKRNRLRLNFDKRSWTKFNGRDGRNLDAEVEVTLPYGVDIILEVSIKAGEVTMDLGGIRLQEFVFNNWAGEVEVDFDEPNPIIMKMMDINARVGECRLMQLGNARFEKADINGGIGEIEVDFSGDLVNDSRAKVDLDIGEATVIVPRDIGVKLNIGGGFSFLSEKNVYGGFRKRGGTYFSDDFDDSRDRFYVRVTPGLGELTVERE